MARTDVAGSGSRGRVVVGVVVEAIEGRKFLAADSSLRDYYVSGKGSGLHFQTLPGYAIATTYGTIIAGSTDHSALDDSNPATGASPVRSGFAFSRENLGGYDPARGGAKPWANRFKQRRRGGADREYIKANFPDSAGAATAIYSGVKTFNGAIGVDAFERPVETIFERAAGAGKSVGAVSSVPVSHATPGAAYAHVNRRGKYDGAFADLDNILQQGLQRARPTVLLGGGHPASEVGDAFVSAETYAALKYPADPNGYGYTFVERGPNAAEALAAAAERIDPQAGGRLLGLYGARGQEGNLPWRTADGDYGNAGLAGQGDAARPLEVGETDAAFVAREREENPTLADLTSAALTVLAKDPDGFVAMIEGGDIDFAAHDNAIDNLIGGVLAFDDAVGRVQNWIEANGGYARNLLIVTADHDHYLTLNADFPSRLRTQGAAALQAADDPASAAHFWGSDPAAKYGWATHTNRPVPVYYAGPKGAMRELRGKTGKGIDAYGVRAAGVRGMIDNTHLFQTMNAGLSSAKAAAKNVILMIGDGMGWEMARAAAIQNRIGPTVAGGSAERAG